MSTIVLGCDSNGNDKECQETVAKILEDAGHTVEKLTIGPSPFADYSYGKNGKNPKGKIGVYLMAASLVSYLDAAKAQFKYNYFGIRGDISTLIKSWKDFDTKGIPKDHHGDCPASLCDKWAGKSYKELNESFQDRCCATFGANPKEIGNNILKAMGGETSSGSEESKPTSSAAKECIQKLLKHWDGEVECRIRGNQVLINKVREPQSNYSLLLKEGLNIFSDSIKVTDVNPNTVNYLVVKWSEGKITIKDEELIKRFGTIRSEVEAVKKIIKTTTKNTSSDTSSSDTSLEGLDTGTGDTTDTTGTGDTTGTEGTDTSADTGSTETETTVVDVPITNYKDALAFANTEWHKIKRDNGHTLECQVPGSPNWRDGEWCKVIIPSFGENGYMYITRASHSDDGGDWTCSLTLQDYPPGWGVEETENNSNSNNSGATNASGVVDKICSEISKFSYSNSCSDGNCIKSSKKGDCWALSDYIYNRLKSEGISAKIYQYKTSGSNQHRQVKYNNGSEWVEFPYSKSSIDHNFYTNSIPSGATVCKD